VVSCYSGCAEAQEVGPAAATGLRRTLASARDALEKPAQAEEARWQKEGQAGGVLRRAENE